MSETEKTETNTRLKIRPLKTGLKYITQTILAPYTGLLQNSWNITLIQA